MEKVKILDVNIDNIGYDTVVKQIDNFIISKKPHQICTVNPEYLMASLKDAELKHILDNASLNVADGGGLWFASFYQGKKLDYKVTGVDLVKNLVNVSQKKHWKIFLLGGMNGVAQKTAEALKKQYPKSQIVGTFEGKPILRAVSKKTWLGGYKFGRSMDVKTNKMFPKNNADIIQAVVSEKPDILLVAYGCPKQDKFIARYAHYLQVPVMIGVGGTFDYLSGKIKRAPHWMQSLHLEWLYRLLKNPRDRWNRIVTAVIKFPLAVVFNKNK